MIKNKQGFTLIELLVALGIFVMIAMAASWIMIYGLRHNRIIWDQLQTQTDGRRVLQDVVDDVRQAEESSLGGYPLITATDNELSFYANIDDDSWRERVRFWLEGTTVKRGVIKPAGNPLNYSQIENIVEIAHEVVNLSQGTPLFLYYDESYTGTEASLEQPVVITDIRAVRVQLELERDPMASPVPLLVESLVEIRNLKTN